MQQGRIALQAFQRLQEDTDGAAASEPGLPGDFVLDAELQHLGLAGGQHLRGFGDHFPLDAAARNRAEEIASSVDRKLAADGAWRRAPGLNDGGKGHAAALGQPVERAWNDAWIAGTHRLLRNSQISTVKP